MPQSHAPGQLSLPALWASSSPLPSDFHLLSACSFFFFKVVTISLEILHLPQPLPPHQAACAVSTALDSSSLHKRWTVLPAPGPPLPPWAEEAFPAKLVELEILLSLSASFVLWAFSSSYNSIEVSPTLKNIIPLSMDTKPLIFHLPAAHYSKAPLPHLPSYSDNIPSCQTKALFAVLVLWCDCLGTCDRATWSGSVWTTSFTWPLGSFCFFSFLTSCPFLVPFPVPSSSYAQLLSIGWSPQACALDPVPSSIFSLRWPLLVHGFK